MNSREKDVQAKQEGESFDNSKMISRTTTTSRQWAGFKNPRIVRVSRTFGGKDRHSKVCTVRGLRDRRIRLSVPTAIQLYDLQDRLGLSQPSKVVDWLIDATKDDIDKLPPLQIPPGNFSQFNQPSLFSQDSLASQTSMSHFFNTNSPIIKDENTQKGIDINDHFIGNDQTSLGRSRFWNSDGKNKEIEQETPSQQENLVQNSFGGYVPQLSAQNFFPVVNQSSFSGVNVLNNTLPYNPYFHWDPSSLSLSQFGNHSATFQAEDSQNHQPLPFPSGSQLYFYPSVTSVPSIVPTYPQYMNTSIENSEARQINPLQLLSSTPQQVLPNNNLMPTLHLMSSTMTSRPNLPPSQGNDDNHMNEG